MNSQCPKDFILITHNLCKRIHTFLLGSGSRWVVWCQKCQLVLNWCSTGALLVRNWCSFVAFFVRSEKWSRVRVNAPTRSRTGNRSGTTGETDGIIARPGLGQGGRAPVRTAHQLFLVPDHPPRPGPQQKCVNSFT